jgi:hypothetical protein
MLFISASALERCFGDKPAEAPVVIGLAALAQPPHPLVVRERQLDTLEPEAR